MSNNDFTANIDALKVRISAMRDKLHSEEATKISLVLPLIKALGYDIFDPEEVIPEFYADFGVKKSEQVDFCITKNSNPEILIECKACNVSLDKHKSQLYRYFSSTNAAFAILTNGIEYQFYTDTEKQNVMDESPFATIDLETATEWQTDFLYKFHKDEYNRQTLKSTARNAMKSISEHSKRMCKVDMFSKALQMEIENPSPEFVRFFLKKTDPSLYVWDKVISDNTPILKDALKQLIKTYNNEH